MGSAIWSPQQISARLKVDHPDDQDADQSRDDLSVSICAVPWGTAPAADRAVADRVQHASLARASRGPRPDPGLISIAERPPEVDDRAPGHWEGDLLVGAAGKSAIATLVERHTRYVMLARLEDQTAHVTGVLAERHASPTTW